MSQAIFQAIADPTRREIIRMISIQSLPLNSVAEHFDMSRQAVSKHIRVLTDCGLVTLRQRGRERYCEARLDGLQEVSAWIEQYRKFWNARLDSLESYLSQIQKKDKIVKKNKN